MTSNESRNQDELREQLSALIDGELPREQTLFLLKRMEHDEALRQEWDRLHRIRDALNDIEPVSGDGFSSRVMAAIAIDSPATGKSALQHSAPRLRGWVQTVAGGAVAAGVAALALWGSMPTQVEPAQRSVAVNAAPAGNPGSAATGAMLLPQQVFSQASQTSGGTPVAIAPANLQLDRYLLRHAQALQQNGQAQPLAPSVYAVSFGDSPAPIAVPQ